MRSVSWTADSSDEKASSIEQETCADIEENKKDSSVELAGKAHSRIEGDNSR